MPKARLTVAVAAATLTALAACSTDDQVSGSGSDGPIAVSASDSTCDVATAELPAGTHTFLVSNEGNEVTEFYVYGTGDRVIGEVENIAPSLTRELTVELAAGDYQTACKPGMVGDGIRSDLTVTGESKPLSDDAALADAVDGYQRYVISQAEAFVTRTTEFAAAVSAGDIEQAKALYPVARTYFERIEPVAESFGDLDPKIDAREGDTEPGVEWTGYHRLEKALWVDGNAAELTAIADQLVADAEELFALVQDAEIAPLDLANGAKGLLDEVATGKITGEEDRYSHTDLWDFQANVEGSKSAIAALRPVLDERDPDLGTEIDEKFAAVQTALEQHHVGDGWKLYTDLTPDQVKELSDVINAISEPISQVAAVVAGP